MMDIVKRILVSIIIVLGAVVQTSGGARAEPSIFNVQRGINLAAPFARTTKTGRFPIAGQVSAYDGLKRYFAPRTIAQMAAVGVQLVRMPVNPVPLLENKGLPRLALLDEIMRAVAQFNSAGIVVVVDLHFWSDEAAWTEATILDGDTGPGFKAFQLLIEELARRLAVVPHGLVALELLNEPQECRHNHDASWPNFQEQLVADIRRVSVDLPIVVTGCGGQLDGLLELQNHWISDQNLVYTFHFYEPFMFTHQSIKQYYPLIRHLPYPPAPRLLNDALGNVDSAAEEQSRTGLVSGMLAIQKAKLEVRRYFNAAVDRSGIIERFAEVTSWAGRASVPLNRILLGEFAALATPPNTTDADYASQLRWIGDVRRAAETQGFAFAYWLYRDKNGDLINSATLKLNPYLGPALGLSMSNAHSMAPEGGK